MKPVLACVVATGLIPGGAFAQELEPRAYSPSPIGTTFIVISAIGSSGGVFTDPSAPIRDAEADIAGLGLGAGHVFSLAGRQALVLGLVPVTWGEASGEVGDERRVASRRGLADPRFKFSVILAGSPAMTPPEFVRAPRRRILGVSLAVAPPAGQYDPAKLINLGSHRWSFKPEIGFSYPAGRWTLDTYAGLWLFTGNREYYPGTSVREQDPIFALQGHASYTLGRRAWAAFNATWYTGGRTTIDGLDKADLQRNLRVGATLALPIGARQSVKLSYSAGAATRIGADFRTFGVGWQMLVF